MKITKIILPNSLATDSSSLGISTLSLAISSPSYENILELAV